MSRSSYVYVVQINSHPVAGFTVKHELETYLDRNWPKCPTNMRVLRLRDNGWKCKTLPASTDITAKLYGVKA